MTWIIFGVALFAASFANALPVHSRLLQFADCSFFPALKRGPGYCQSSNATPKIGGIIESHNLIWGESIGWINLKTTHVGLKIGSDIVSGWIWLENCGWVCLGEGRPLRREWYSNRSAYDFGINNDSQGNLSGYAWSDIMGWISFRTSPTFADFGIEAQLS